MEHETQKQYRELLEKWMLGWEGQKEKLNPSDNADSRNNLTEKGNIATIILEKMKELEPMIYIPNGIGSVSTDGSAGFMPEGNVCTSICDQGGHQQSKRPHNAVFEAWREALTIHP